MEPPSILFVVTRDRVDLYESLQRSFSDEASVEVILDRRHRERRQSSNLTGEERREGERRIQTTNHTLQSNSFAVIRRLPARLVG